MIEEIYTKADGRTLIRTMLSRCSCTFPWHATLTRLWLTPESNWEENPVHSQGKDIEVGHNVYGESFNSSF